MNCKTCRWWTRLTIGEAPSIAYYDFARANEPSSTGTCRGGPPTPVGNGGHVWPTTDEGEYCGAFAAREGA